MSTFENKFKTSPSREDYIECAMEEGRSYQEAAAIYDLKARFNTEPSLLAGQIEACSTVEILVPNKDHPYQRLVPRRMTPDEIIEHFEAEFGPNLKIKLL